MVQFVKKFGYFFIKFSNTYCMFDGNCGYDVHDSTAALTEAHMNKIADEKRREGEDEEDVNKDILGLR